jgi:heme exporter protein B
MFVGITTAIIRFSIGEERVSDEVLTGFLWVIVFFASVSGLSRTFVKEEEKETSQALKLSTGAIPVLIGKMIFNLVLTFSLNFFIILLFIIVSGYNIVNTAGFLITVILGTFGLVSASTIIAAIISKANSKGTLYPVLSFPVLLPLLLTVINATKLASLGAVTGELFEELKVLVSYTVVITTASLLLFKYVWED